MSWENTEVLTSFPKLSQYYTQGISPPNSHRVSLNLGRSI